VELGAIYRLCVSRCLSVRMFKTLPWDGLISFHKSIRDENTENVPGKTVARGRQVLFTMTCSEEWKDGGGGEGGGRMFRFYRLEALLPRLSITLISFVHLKKWNVTALIHIDTGTSARPSLTGPANFESSRVWDIFCINNEARVLQRAMSDIVRVFDLSSRGW